MVNIILILRTTSSLCLSIRGGRTALFLATLEMEGSVATRFSSIRYSADDIIFLNFRWYWGLQRLIYCPVNEGSQGQNLIFIRWLTAPRLACLSSLHSLIKQKLMMLNAKRVGFTVIIRWSFMIMQRYHYHPEDPLNGDMIMHLISFPEANKSSWHNFNIQM